MNEEMIGWISSAVTSTGLRVVLAGVLLDAVLGISLALKLNTFDWKKLANFMKTSIAPYSVAYVGLYVITASLHITESELGIAGVQTVLSGLIMTNLVSNITDKFKQLGVHTVV